MEVRDRSNSRISRYNRRQLGRETEISSSMPMPKPDGIIKFVGKKVPAM
jgi:hypothetical protein